MLKKSRVETTFSVINDLKFFSSAKLIVRSLFQFFRLYFRLLIIIPEGILFQKCKITIFKKWTASCDVIGTWQHYVKTLIQAKKDEKLFLNAPNSKFYFQEISLVFIKFSICDTILGAYDITLTSFWLKVVSLHAIFF